MKMKLLQKKGSSCAAMFAAATITCLSLAQQGEAAVTWMVTQVGDDVVMAVDGGTLEVPASLLIYSSNNSGQNYGNLAFNGNIQSFFGGPTDVYYKYQLRDVGDFGTNVAGFTNPPTYSVVATSVTGTKGLAVYNIANPLPGGTSAWLVVNVPGYDGSALSYTPDVSMTFSDTTISAMFGSNLDEGPQLLWTGTTGDTVSIALSPVPEPSNLALLALGACGVLTHRRRKRAA